MNTIEFDNMEADSGYKLTMEVSEYPSMVAFDVVGQGWEFEKDGKMYVETGINLTFDQAIVFAEEILRRAGKR